MHLKRLGEADNAQLPGRIKTGGDWELLYEDLHKMHQQEAFLKFCFVLFW